MPIYQLKKVIIPKFVDLIDEKLFKSGENKILKK